MASQHTQTCCSYCLTGAPHAAAQRGRGLNGKTRPNESTGTDMRQPAQTQLQDEGVFVAWLPNECRQALDGAPPDPHRLAAGQGRE